VTASRDEPSIGHVSLPTRGAGAIRLGSSTGPGLPLPDSLFVMDAMKWAKEHNLPMIDLGGAFNSPPGYTSVDLQDADVNCNIREGLPFETSSVGVVRASDFLEHIPHCVDSSCTHGAPYCTVGMMNEIHRVLVSDGWFLSHTPSTDGRGAFQDPSHCSFWNPNSFWYYCQTEQRKYVRNLSAEFAASRVWQEYPSPWHEQHHILYVGAHLRAVK